MGQLVSTQAICLTSEFSNERFRFDSYIRPNKEQFCNNMHNLIEVMHWLL
jgi:hypothetical protein